MGELADSRRRVSAGFRLEGESVESGPVGALARFGRLLDDLLRLSVERVGNSQRQVARLLAGGVAATRHLRLFAHRRSVGEAR